MTDKPTCKTCKYWKINNHEYAAPDTGWCKPKFPPAFQSLLFGRCSEKTHAEQTCDFHKPIELKP